MGQIKLIGSFLFIALFSIAVIAYATNFGNDNDAPVNINQDSRINASGLRSDVTSFKVNTSSTSTAFKDLTIAPGDETAAGGGVFKSITGTIGSVWVVLDMGKDVLFGGDEEDSPFGILFTAFSAFLVMLLVLYAWKSWRGNPD